LCGQRRGPTAIWRFSRGAFLPSAFPVNPQDLFWVLAFSPFCGPLSAAFPILERWALRLWFSGVAPAQALALSFAALL
jgi:hypothetical protein